MIESIAQQITPTSIVLFFAYTLVALLAALVARIGVGNMGKKAEAGAIEAVTAAFSGSIADARQARIELTDEREKRAKLEGKVESLMTQSTQEKSRADSAYEKLNKQTNQIENLTKEVSQLTSDINTIRERLTKVEAEKKALQDEKEKLENALSTQSDEYRKLMESIQERIDKAVADVRDELRVKYEERITTLEKEIRARDEEIVKLHALLKEMQTHEESTATFDAADASLKLGDSADVGTGGDGSPSSDSGNDSGTPSGGIPSA